MRSEDEKNLVIACYCSKFDKIKALLEKGVNPQFTLIGYPENGTEMDNYKTPLGAIMNSLYSQEHVEAVKALLGAGADVNTSTHHTVFRTHSTPLGRALLSHETCFNVTKAKVQQEIVEFLLNRGADVKLLSEDDLAQFMDNGTLPLLESLLNAGLNPSTVVKGKFLLEYVIDACTDSWWNEKAEMAKLLINRGANLFVKDRNEKSLAQKAQRPDIVNLLLEKDEQFLDNLTLHDRVILESPQFVQKLISRGDNINVLNEQGNTPLMEAAMMGNAKTVFVLMEAGANMNLYNSEGETALHLAMAKAQNFSCVRCDYTSCRQFPILLELYSRGAAPFLDTKGCTPLMRCLGAALNSQTIKFCINEFSRFEAQYYSFNANEYAQEMFNAYVRYIGQHEAFMHLSIQEKPEHIFIKKLKRISLPVIALTREQLVNKAIKDLLIALKNNNEIKVGEIISRFPEIDLNQIKDEEGHRSLSMVIRAVVHSMDDCLPLLALLLKKSVDVNLSDNTKEKDTPLLACNTDQHRIDIRSMKLLLDNGANPNISNSKKETPLHRSVGTFRYDHNVEDAIELLLLNGANPDTPDIDGKKPKDRIVLAWEENQIPSIFDKFKLQKNNLIDSALSLALLPINRMLFAKALKNNFTITVGGLDIPLVNLIENLSTRKDLTLFTQNKLAFLNLIQEDPLLVEEKEFSEDESKIIYS